METRLRLSSCKTQPADDARRQSRSLASAAYQLPLQRHNHKLQTRRESSRSSSSPTNEHNSKANPLSAPQTPPKTKTKTKTTTATATRAPTPTLDYGAKRVVSSRLALGLAILASGAIMAHLNPGTVRALDCFKCSSRNGSNPACEDPFHNLNSTRVTSPIMPDPPPNVAYQTPCYAGRKGRDGLFPASACIKLTGTFARMSHCGRFQFEGDSLKGCVLACPEDACNSATKRPTVAIFKLTQQQWHPLGLLLAAISTTLIITMASRQQQQQQVS